VGLFAGLMQHALQQHRINRAVNRRLTILEYRMALTDQALADLDAATNEVAAELEDLRDLLTGADQAVADRITAAAGRLRGLAADPEQPVPPPV
jgi:uncharacterized coiled-coil protein SlyX